MKTRQNPYQWSLHSSGGQRKYLNQAERNRFIEIAKLQPEHIRTLCLTLAHSGCRISEALQLSSSSVQCETSLLAIRTLKKRGRLVVREVPIPDSLAEQLACRGQSTYLWPIGRTLAWRWIKDVMAQADIVGLHATPKGLRHGFGVHAIRCGVPLNLVQRWLGHASISTTAIYLDVCGPEERELAKLMW